MSKSGGMFMEQDDYEETEGDAIDPQEIAYISAFQAMNHILSQDKMHKVFGGKRFEDFTKFIDEQ